MNHGVEGALVESHINRCRGNRLFQGSDVRPAPFDSLLLRMSRSHQLESRVGEVETELVVVASGGEVGGNSLIGRLVLAS